VPPDPPVRAGGQQGLAWVLWVLCALGLVAVFWLDYLLRRAGRSELALRAHEVP
jgi:hypothetical protein